jgi:type 1 glutamine amidotransferase
MLHRRDVLRAAGAAALGVGLGTFPRGWAAPNRGKKQRLLFFTRSAGFQHDVIDRAKAGKDGRLGIPDQVAHAEHIVTDLGAKHDFEVVCTKDGRIFIPEEIAKFDAFLFYTTEDLTAEKSTDGSPPMPKEGKRALLDAVAGGKGFLGSHCASDTFHSRGHKNGDLRGQTPADIDPYIAMLGGEFIVHGDQQKAKMRVVDPHFPGARGLADFDLREEWYALKNFAPDLHVILAQDSAGMRGDMYKRPLYPATWARMHQKGRVFYTSMGHREDVWTNPTFQQILLGGLSWAFGNVEADVTPNIDQVTPRARELKAS